MDTIIQSLFPNLSNDAHQLIKASATLKTFEQGTLITNEQDLCDHLFIVYQGLVQVFQLNEAGQQVTLYDVKDGGVCMKNLQCMLHHQPFHAQAKALANTTLLIIPKNIFTQHLQHDAPFLMSLLTSTLGRLTDLHAHYQAMSFLPVKKRLCLYLKTRSNDYNQRIIYRSHGEIAAEIGTAREVVSRHLKVLETEGLLSLKRGKIILNKKPSV